MFKSNVGDISDDNFRGMKTGIELIAFVVPSHMPGHGGWGNGYVAIPKKHPCFGMDYSEAHNRYRSISVHGGLTFADSGHINQPKETKGMWILGFDTLHAGDSLSRWPSKESVMEETDKLKAQLIRIYKRSKQNPTPK